MNTAIYAAIPKLMGIVGHVEKSRKNQQQGYMFRGIDDFLSAVQKPFSDVGVFIVPTVLTESRELRETKSGGTMTYTVLKMMFRFYATDGSYVEATTVGEAMDSGDKSSNKAMSAALKYAITQVLSIPAHGDDDTENFTPPETRPAAPPRPAVKAKDATPPADAMPVHIQALIDSAKAAKLKKADLEQLISLRYHDCPSVKQLDQAQCKTLISDILKTIPPAAKPPSVPPSIDDDGSGGKP